MSATLQRNDAAESVRSRVRAEEWETRVQLAACYRLSAHYGWTDLIYTHISARVPGPDEHFLLNPFGWMFYEITASNPIKVDLAGNIIGQTPPSIHKAGFLIQSAVHEERPDVACVIHSHTRAGMAVSMTKCGLLPFSQHAMLFHGRVAYHDSEGLALDMDEQARLATDLGDKAVMILRNHGTLVAGMTIPEAFSMMSHLEKALQAQIDALSSKQELTIRSDEVAAATASMGFTNKVVPEYTEGTSPLGRLEWPAPTRMLDRTDASYRN